MNIRILGAASPEMQTSIDEFEESFSTSMGNLSAAWDRFLAGCMEFVTGVLTWYDGLIAALPEDWRTPVSFLISSTLAFTLLAIAAAFPKGMFDARNARKEKPGTHRCYGLFHGGLQHKRRQAYAKALGLLSDSDWFPLSYAWISGWLEHKASGKGLISLVLSLLSFCLAWPGIAELFLRGTVGHLILICENVLLWLAFAIIGLAARIIGLLPVLFERVMRHDWHCPDCFETFQIPICVCPKCGYEHEGLVPGDTGLLFSRCTCGELMSVGLSSLEKKCPRCHSRQHANSAATDDSVVLVGGESSGKTSWLLGIQHTMLHDSRVKWKHPFGGQPSGTFKMLETAFQRHDPATVRYPTKEALTLRQRYSEAVDVSIVLYGESTGGYGARHPYYLGYATGMILFVDPLSSDTALAQAEASMGSNVLRHRPSKDSAQAELRKVVDEYRAQLSLSTSKMIDVPLAVVITKSDISSVKARVSDMTIRRAFERDPGKYGYDIDLARDAVCCDYLDTIGMSGLCNYVTGNFKSVHYFLTSNATDGCEGSNLAPLKAVLRSRHAATIASVMDVLSGDNPRGVIDRMRLSQSYRAAARQMAEGHLDEARKQFDQLGSYGQAERIAEDIVSGRVAKS